MNNRKNISKKSQSASGNIGGSSNNNEYNSTPSDRFYTLKEEIILRFYQTPKALFNNLKYKGLSLGPKLMYSILRDRLDLSIKNNWKDNKGYIYLIFSIEELADFLEIDRKAVMRYKKLLADYGLIIDKRLGQGRPNRIYVLKPELWDNQKSNKNFSFILIHLIAKKLFIRMGMDFESVTERILAVYHFILFFREQYKKFNYLLT